ncbi:hypothetical protein BGZ57DRAFT_860444 [Hyaloscypha finlandica]|nr:hypothetical protein BGZ57DRAFT_860444 [Hyaloscypha finlandica]
MSRRLDEVVSAAGHAEEGEDEVVGKGEGTFQGYAPSYAWLLVSSPTTINGIEECWETTLEVEKRNQGSVTENGQQNTTLLLLPDLRPAPFHTQEYYPRSYTCLLDFLALAISLPAGQPLPTTPIKPLTEHDFVIRLCKGNTAPILGPNQWGAARYFLPDPSVPGGLVEVLHVESGSRGNDLDHLRWFLNEGGGKFGCFMYLEDVWMTVLCPVHGDSVWFLQFWVKGPKDNEELEEVSKRVTDRRNQEPGFVEGPFSSKFFEMMGIPSPPQQSNRSPNRDEDEPKPYAFGGVGGGGVDEWRGQDEKEKTRFQDRRRRELGLLPNLPVGYQQSRSIPPAQYGRGEFWLPHNRAGPQQLTPNRQLDGIEEAGDGTTGGNQTQPKRPPFQGTELQQRDPALREPQTPQSFDLRLPPGFGFGDLHQKTSAAPATNDLNPWQTPELHSPQPARHFQGAIEMWQSPEPRPELLARPLGFHEQDEQGYGGEPHGVHRPLPPLPPALSYPQAHTPQSTTKMAEAGRTSPIKALFLSACRVAHHRLAAKRLDKAGAIEVDSMLKNPTQTPRPQPPVSGGGGGGTSGPMRDTIVAGASAYAPPTGNTSGLRPIQRWTWDAGTKQWRAYWVWRL